MVKKWQIITSYLPLFQILMEGYHSGSYNV